MLAIKHGMIRNLKWLLEIWTRAEWAEEVKRFGHWNSNCLFLTMDQHGLCHIYSPYASQCLSAFDKCCFYFVKLGEAGFKHQQVNTLLSVIQLHSSNCVDMQKWKSQTSWHTSCHLKESSSLSTDRQLISSSLPHSQREVGSVWKCLCFMGSRGVSSWCRTDMWMSGNSVQTRDP